MIRGSSLTLLGVCAWYGSSYSTSRFLRQTLLRPTANIVRSHPGIMARARKPQQRTSPPPPPPPPPLHSGGERPRPYVKALKDLARVTADIDRPRGGVSGALDPLGTAGSDITATESAGRNNAGGAMHGACRIGIGMVQSLIGSSNFDAAKTQGGIHHGRNRAEINCSGHEVQVRVGFSQREMWNTSLGLTLLSPWML